MTCFATRLPGSMVEILSGLRSNSDYWILIEPTHVAQQGIKLFFTKARCLVTADVIEHRHFYKVIRVRDMIDVNLERTIRADQGPDRRRDSTYDCIEEEELWSGHGPCDRGREASVSRQ